MKALIETRVKEALERADGNKLTYAELKEITQMRQGLARYLEGMKRAGVIDFAPEAEIMIVDETIILLSIQGG